VLEIDTFGICQPWQLKFLRPYVNTELQQIPNLSRYTNIAYLHIDYGLLCCLALTASECLPQDSL